MIQLFKKSLVLFFVAALAVSPMFAVVTLHKLPLPVGWEEWQIDLWSTKQAESHKGKWATVYAQKKLSDFGEWGEIRDPYTGKLYTNQGHVCVLNSDAKTGSIWFYRTSEALEVPMENEYRLTEGQVSPEFVTLDDITARKIVTGYNSSLHEDFKVAIAKQISQRPELATKYSYLPYVSNNQEVKKQVELAQQAAEAVKREQEAKFQEEVARRLAKDKTAWEQQNTQLQQALRDEQAKKQREIDALQGTIAAQMATQRAALDAERQRQDADLRAKEEAFARDFAQQQKLLQEANELQKKQLEDKLQQLEQEKQAALVAAQATVAGQSALDAQKAQQEYDKKLRELNAQRQQLEQEKAAAAEQFKQQQEAAKLAQEEKAKDLAGQAKQLQEEKERLAKQKTDLEAQEACRKSDAETQARAQIVECERLQGDMQARLTDAQSEPKIGEKLVKFNEAKGFAAQFKGKAQEAGQSAVTANNDALKKRADELLSTAITADGDIDKKIKQAPAKMMLEDIQKLDLGPAKRDDSGFWGFPDARIEGPNFYEAQKIAVKKVLNLMSKLAECVPGKANWIPYKLAPVNCILGDVAEVIHKTSATPVDEAPPFSLSAEQLKRLISLVMVDDSEMLKELLPADEWREVESLKAALGSLVIQNPAVYDKLLDEVLNTTVQGSVSGKDSTLREVLGIAVPTTRQRISSFVNHNPGPVTIGGTVAVLAAAGIGLSGKFVWDCSKLYREQRLSYRAKTFKQVMGGELRRLWNKITPKRLNFKSTAVGDE